MNDRTLLRVGIVGALIAAVCCFTPALVILLGAVGLSAVVVLLDYLLLPLLILFVGIAMYAVDKRKKLTQNETSGKPKS